VPGGTRRGGEAEGPWELHVRSRATARRRGRRGRRRVGGRAEGAGTRAACVQCRCPQRPRRDGRPRARARPAVPPPRRACHTPTMRPGGSLGSRSSGSSGPGSDPCRARRGAVRGPQGTGEISDTTRWSPAEAGGPRGAGSARARGRPPLCAQGARGCGPHDV
jgi:hypothetical protein